MRTSVLTILIMGLTAGSALATGPGRGGGNQGGNSIKSAMLQVMNTCDEAVQVTVDDRPSVFLEPNTSATFGYWQKNLPNPTVTAALVSIAGISDSERCRLQDGKTTIATVTCATTAAGTTLEVDCLAPGETLAFVNRDSAVAIASTSGLGFLFLLGMLLGRAPRRLRREASGEEGSIAAA